MLTDELFTLSGYLAGCHSSPAECSATSGGH